MYRQNNKLNRCTDNNDPKGQWSQFTYMSKLHDKTQ